MPDEQRNTGRACDDHGQQQHSAHPPLPCALPGAAGRRCHSALAARLSCAAAADCKLLLGSLQQHGRLAVALLHDEGGTSTFPRRNMRAAAAAAAVARAMDAAAAPGRRSSSAPAASPEDACLLLLFDANLICLRRVAQLSQQPCGTACIPERQRLQYEPNKLNTKMRQLALDLVTLKVSLPVLSMMD